LSRLPGQVFRRIFRRPFPFYLPPPDPGWQHPNGGGQLAPRACRIATRLAAVCSGPRQRGRARQELARQAEGDGRRIAVRRPDRCPDVACRLAGPGIIIVCRHRLLGRVGCGRRAWRCWPQVRRQGGGVADGDAVPRQQRSGSGFRGGSGSCGGSGQLEWPEYSAEPGSTAVITARPCLGAKSDPVWPSQHARQDPQHVPGP
jgi:hypothetical protein